MPHHNFRIIQLVRAVGPSNSAWTNFYGSFRETFPGMAFPPLEIRVFARGPGLKTDFCREKRRKFFSAGLLNSVLLLRELSKRCNSRLIVHIHAPSLTIVVVLALLAGAKLSVVNTQHSVWRNFRWHQKLSLWLLSFLSAAYIGCSDQSTASIPSSNKQRLIRSGRLGTISNGVPMLLLKDMAASRRVKLHSDKSRRTFTTSVVARMSPVKNGKVLLGLVAQLPELGHVTWYGDGSLRHELESLAETLGIRARITFAGMVRRQEVYDALVGTDFYLTVSLWEGLAIADLEAVAMGCVPLMSDIPERQVIAESVGFRLLPLDNVSAWKAAIREYIDQTPEQRAALALERSCNALHHFSLERMVISYVEVYRRISSEFLAC